MSVALDKWVHAGKCFMGGMGGGGYPCAGHRLRGLFGTHKKTTQFVKIGRRTVNVCHAQPCLDFHAQIAALLGYGFLQRQTAQRKRIRQSPHRLLAQRHYFVFQPVCRNQPAQPNSQPCRLRIQYRQNVKRVQYGLIPLRHNALYMAQLRFQAA